MAAAQQPSEIYKVGLASVRFLLAVGDLLIGWRLLAQADVAHAALVAAPTNSKAFYQGKSVSAKFFANNVLPKLTLRGIIESLEDDIMRLPQAAF